MSKTEVKNALDLRNKNGRKQKNFEYLIQVISLVKVISIMMQNCVAFQPVFKYFKMPTNSSAIIAQKSKSLSEESIKPCATSNNSLAPEMTFSCSKTRIKFYKSL